jgi:hypothetical protein
VRVVADTAIADARSLLLLLLLLLPVTALLLQVNADSHRSLGERFEVQGFPTLKWFSRGKPVTKDGAEA